MMRSPKYFAVACRAPSGQLVLETEAIAKTWIGRQRWLKWPFLRGTFGILDHLTLGTRCMNFTAQVQMQGDPDAPQTKGAEKIQNMAVGIAIVVGLALGIVLFQFLPQVIAQATGAIGVTSGTVMNLITETLKIAFFVGYAALIARMPEVRRLVQYHGAEHKAINVLEAGEELTLENCRRQTRLHPRCGTSFVVIVVLLSFAFFPFVPRNPLDLDNSIGIVGVRMAIEIFIMLPVVAGVAYELIRLAGRFRNQRWLMALFWPGLASQRVTTAEPNDDQIEVAMAALAAVLHAEATGELERIPLETTTPATAPA